MAAAGIKDILIANQVVGHHKVTRLVNLRRRANVMVAVDTLQNVQELSSAAQEKGVELRVLVEVNLGLNRCGVEPGEPAVTLARQVHESRGLRYMGVMGYEGHAMDLSISPQERQRMCEEAIGLLTTSAQMCRDAGLPVQIVSGGGSFDYKIYSHLPGVTEIEAGGAVFGDVTYRAFDVDTDCSLFILSTVTSRHGSRAVVDAGRKSMNGDVGMPEVYGRTGIKLVSLHAEHGLLELESDDIPLNVGDKLDFIVGYGDNNSTLYDQLYGVRQGKVEVVWDIQARGKLR
jgi:D-serine deaminase-like pyridoxal phosphate-dependent protein